MIGGQNGFQILEFLVPVTIVETKSPVCGRGNELIKLLCKRDTLGYE
jgi:hypothetical protein